MQAKKAVLLFSGGLDSTTVLAMAQAEGYEIYALNFDYGQRHKCEIEAAQRIVELTDVADYRTIQIDLAAFGGSSLIDPSQIVEKNRMTLDASADDPADIPSTYVPARNTIFLSHALGFAEIVGAKAIFIGANALDYSGYPDCRPEFFEAYENLANLATASGVGGSRVEIKTPLLHLSKADIIKMGTELGVDYAMTHSCYDPVGDLACGSCDSCILRHRGFEEAQIADPTRYAAGVAWPKIASKNSSFPTAGA